MNRLLVNSILGGIGWAIALGIAAPLEANPIIIQIGGTHRHAGYQRPLSQSTYNRGYNRYPSHRPSANHDYRWEREQVRR
jgi:hypothetical protein